MNAGKAGVAVELFGRELHCSQAVVAAYAEDCGISYEQAVRIGSCLGSGMRKGAVCGACTGALIVLGLLYGQHSENDAEGRQRSNKVNDLLMERFSALCGSYGCKEILGCDISTSEGLAYARSNGLFAKSCPKAVENAVQAIEEIRAEIETTRS